MVDDDGEGDENNKGEGANLDVVDDDGEGDENNKGDGEMGDDEEAMGENDGDDLFLCLFLTLKPAFFVFNILYHKFHIFAQLCHHIFFCASQCCLYLKISSNTAHTKIHPPCPLLTSSKLL